jgi:hypothetical protein
VGFLLLFPLSLAEFSPFLCYDFKSFLQQEKWGWLFLSLSTLSPKALWLGVTGLRQTESTKCHVIMSQRRTWGPLNWQQMSSWASQGPSQQRVHGEGEGTETKQWSSCSHLLLLSGRLHGLSQYYIPAWTTPAPRQHLFTSITCLLWDRLNELLTPSPRIQFQRHIYWWLTPVILAIWEAEIRRIAVQRQPRHIAHKTLSKKLPNQNQGWKSSSSSRESS